MHRAMITLLMCAISIVALGCTIEVRPLGYKPPVKKVVVHKKHSAHRRAAAEDSMYVSPEWLTEYRELEKVHGDYTIADDHKIHVDTDGKVKVPRTVLRHFHDLSKTPVAEESPAP
jgi:hypothetical protein